MGQVDHLAAGDFIHIAGADDEAVGPGTDGGSYFVEGFVFAIEKALEVAVCFQSPEAGYPISDEYPASVIQAEAGGLVKGPSLRGGGTLEGEGRATVGGNAPNFSILRDEFGPVEDIETILLGIGNNGNRIVELGGSVRDGFLADEPVEIGLVLGDEDDQVARPGWRIEFGRRWTCSPDDQRQREI